MTDMREIPLHLLVPNPDNPRKVAASGIEHASLVASIEAHGLLQPLLVQEQSPKVQSYMVIDGHRRLAALQELANGSDTLVSCTVRPHTALTTEVELATAANMIRVDMHPLDECDAINSLIGEDAVADIEGVAARFGRTPKWVMQRLALSGLCSCAKKMFRDGLFGMSTASALTLGTQEQQEKYLKGIKEADDWRLRAHTIKGVFTDKAIPAKVALFDLAIYPQDKIQRDLFSDEVFLLDREAFNKLQGAAFDNLVDELKKEGWAEVIAMRDGPDYKVIDRYVHPDGRIKKADRAKFVAILIDGKNGGVEIKRGMALRKQVKKVQKNGLHGADTAKAEDVKPLSPADLTGKQQEQLRDMMRTAVMEQCQVYDTVALWTFVGPLLAQSVPWSRMGKERPPLEDSEAQEPWVSFQAMHEDGSMPQTLAEFEALPIKMRMRVVRLASMLIVQPCDPAKVLEEWDLLGWFRPTPDFLKGWRKDQLDVYAKAIGKPMKIAGEGAPSSKTEQVAHILAAIADGAEPVPPLPQFFGEAAPQQPPPGETDKEEIGDDEEEAEGFDEDDDDGDEEAEGGESADAFADTPEPGEGEAPGVPVQPAE